MLSWKHCSTLSLLVLSQTAVPLAAHPGGLAADGCHNDRKNGGRHCHGGKKPPPRAQQLFSDDVYFPNCAAARAAGAAPVRAGQPGYARHLDRDGDGVGCE
jgi:Excalibur calcium-binding domain